MTIGLSQRELDVIISVLKRYPDIDQAWLFGSRAMNNHKPGSDVDIALKGKLDPHTAAGVKGQLDDETPLPYFFDVVQYETIENPAFREHIDTYGKLIYDKQTAPLR
ncbi:MAG: nucleotidyltransferase domain-containing protein [Candidatus Omnitrophica bacterium]|nr:nucleotidyltransferase domain-containing protein [Candidatus Omnitrophota bacterium]